MEEPRYTFLKVLFNRYPLGSGDAGISLLPSEDSTALKSLNFNVSDPTPLLTLPEDILGKMHYSWLTPVIEAFPPALKDPLLSSLPSRTQERLRSALKMSPGNTKPLADKQLLRFLGHRMHLENVMPLSFLPVTPLSPLAELSKAQLVEVIDLLSMHDLAEEIRHIVDKKKLQVVYELITARRAQYLKRCLQQKERLVSPKFDIDKYARDPRKLEAFLHQRGILRLGKALSGQHPDFIWHLVHTLDTGRGAILQKCYSPQAIANATPALMEQVVNVLNFQKIESAK